MRAFGYPQVYIHRRARRSGGKVLMVSSLDEEHPGDLAIDGNDASFWISTGLYPQELLLELGQQARISSIKLSTTNVKSVRVEGCSEADPVNFKPLAEGDMEEKSGRMQLKELRCRDQDDATKYVKVMILAGHHDFCSVHKISVE